MNLLVYSNWEINFDFSSLNWIFFGLLWKESLFECVDCLQSDMDPEALMRHSWNDVTYRQITYRGDVTYDRLSF